MAHSLSVCETYTSRGEQCKFCQNEKDHPEDYPHDDDLRQRILDTQEALRELLEAL
jgi:hypothetical protein